MKVIDLLNKIANNEEVPEKIIFDNQNWKKENGSRNNIYYMNDSYFDLFVVIFKNSKTYSLNDEIEIIEEKPKKIEEVPFNNGMECFMDVYHELEQYNYKINDLTKAVNYLLEKESDK